MRLMVLERLTGMGTLPGEPMRLVVPCDDARKFAKYPVSSQPVQLFQNRSPLLSIATEEMTDQFR
jgi:hypothetical protein